jgi:hypothetical protein
MDSAADARQKMDTVLLQDGRQFVGSAEYDGLAVTLSGRERRITVKNGIDTVELGSESRRTWAIGLVREIRWARGVER